MWAAYRNNYVEKAFIRTADEDYITCRWCFFNRFFPGFIWLFGQSIEKYLKAILLVNDRPAKFSHELYIGFEKVLDVYPEFVAQNFAKPDQFPAGLWYNESFVHFLKRLDSFYSSDNRYGGWGHFVLPDDVVKADLVVWNLRRLARPRVTTFGPDNNQRNIDMFEHLQQNSEFWRISNQTPVETLVNETRKDACLTNKTFKNLNFPFFPDNLIFPDGYVSGSAMSALDTIEVDMRNNTDNQEARTALEWMRNNIKAGTKLGKRIDKILE